MIRAPLRPESVGEPAARAGAWASVALAPQLRAAPRTAHVLGASRHVVWCALDDEVVLLTSHESVRFPNGIVASGGWGGLAPGDEVSIGDVAVFDDIAEWWVLRWWDPRVSPNDAVRDDVLERVARIEERAPSGRISPLREALASVDPSAITERASEMLGGGAGLTPEGDDRLMGAVAAFRHVAGSLGRPATVTMLDQTSGELVALARSSTTSLSATLLRHALVGEVAAPVGHLLQALTGRGELASALDGCLAIGSSSGQALAEGVVCGAQAACEVAA